MKKIKVTTVQTVRQTWEYEIEVDDDFEANLDNAVSREIAYDKIPYVDGHCKDDDSIEDESISELEDI
mgnify:CR=1 FL=1|tara:strand:- start:808 stop:1011 length:204 start_codon:yes stop_codon:yes gene_type:complete